MMKTSNTDAMRRVMEEMRAGNLADATSLIQQTLGQSGLNSAASADACAHSRSHTADRQGRRTFSCAAGSREYVVHVPDGALQGVLMMLHGCTQTPEDFAIGTNVVNAARSNGLIVILPAQSHGSNAQSCWNWFSGADQQRHSGEPAILAGLAAEITRAHNVAEKRTYVAGLSAGGAMAVILGETYPDVFAGVGVHSGLPYGCARGVNEAFAAMGGSSRRNPRQPTRSPVPTIVFHGTADTTVAPANGAQIVADRLNSAGQQTQIVKSGTAGGRSYSQTTTLSAGGAPLAEHWEIEGLGHAWSGGNSKGSYADAGGPDATAEMLRFFASSSTSEV